MFSAFVCQVNQLDDSMVFFLASLPQEEYACVHVLDIFSLFEECKLKDQTFTRQQRSLKLSKVDCKGVNFKPLRGMKDSCREEDTFNESSGSGTVLLGNE